MLSNLRVLAWRVVEQSRRLLLQQPLPSRSRNWTPSYNQNQVTTGLKSTRSSGAGPGISRSQNAWQIANGSNSLPGLLGRLGPLVSSAVRRLATPRRNHSYSYRDTAPLFALVGVTLLASHEDDENEEGIARRYRGFITKEEELEALCSSIRQAAYRTSWLYDAPVSPLDVEPDHVYSLKDLDLSGFIDQGCNAVVYAARWKKTEKENVQHDTSFTDENTSDIDNGNASSSATGTRQTASDDTRNANDNSSYYDNATLASLSQLQMQQRRKLIQEIATSTPDLFNPSFSASSDLHSLQSHYHSALSLYQENDQSAGPCTDLLSPLREPSKLDYEEDSLNLSNLDITSHTDQQGSLSSLLCGGSFGSVSRPKRVRFLSATEVEVPFSFTMKAEDTSDEDTNQSSNENKVSASDSSTPSVYPLAVKLVFNYEAASNAPAILSALYKELLPARSIQLDEVYMSWRDSFFGSGEHNLLPYHPNIVDMPCAFVDKVPMLKDSKEHFPYALPPRLNPEGLGRNMTLFCVMRRYDLPLDLYLDKYRDHVPARTSLLLLTQLLEALQHLSANNICHRDLKPDNILLSLIDGWQSPWLVLTDFGCCLTASSKSGLSVPFINRAAEPRQGNAALMAPEVKLAEPGLLKSINFSQCDLWAAGTLAYQFYGLPNPFLKEGDNKDHLDSGTYKESQLPGLMKSTAPPAVRRLIADLLRRKPSHRPDATVAATLCQLSLWGPSSWLNRHSITKPKDEQVMEWLLCLTTKVVCEQKKGGRGSGITEHRIISTFLSRVQYRDVMRAIAWNKAF